LSNFLFFFPFTYLIISSFKLKHFLFFYLFTPAKCFISFYFFLFLNINHLTLYSLFTLTINYYISLFLSYSFYYLFLRIPHFFIRSGFLNRNPRIFLLIRSGFLNKNLRILFFIRFGFLNWNLRLLLNSYFSLVALSDLFSENLYYFLSSYLVSVFIFPFLIYI